MRVTVQTASGRLVDLIDVDDSLSPTAVGRVLTGHNRAVLGWLGRALDDARALERGRDPERPSEQAMRLAQQRASADDDPRGAADR